jgi:hypothetical protein
VKGTGSFLKKRTKKLLVDSGCGWFRQYGLIYKRFFAVFFSKKAALYLNTSGLRHG